MKKEKPLLKNTIAIVVAIVIIVMAVIFYCMTKYKEDRYENNSQVTVNENKSENEEELKKKENQRESKKDKGEIHPNLDYEKLKFETSPEERKRFIESNLASLGVYGKPEYGIIYKSLVDDFEFSQNKDMFFKTSTTIEVPMMMQINEEINLGNLVPSDIFVYQSGDYERGMGSITQGVEERTISEGSEIECQNLCYEMMVNSDNTAKNMVTRRYPDIRKNCVRYADKGEYSPDEYLATPEYMKEVLEILYTNSQYSYTLDLMREAVDYWNMGISDQYPYAKKHGWYDGTISQVGIFFEERPYILIVYRSGMGYVDNRYFNDFRDISDVFYKVNNLD